MSNKRYWFEERLVLVSILLQCYEKYLADQIMKEEEDHEDRSLILLFHIQDIVEEMVRIIR